VSLLIFPVHRVRSIIFCFFNLVLVSTDVGSWHLRARHTFIWFCDAFQLFVLRNLNQFLLLPASCYLLCNCSFQRIVIDLLDLAHRVISQSLSFAFFLFLTFRCPEILLLINELQNVLTPHTFIVTHEIIFLLIIGHWFSVMFGISTHKTLTKCCFRSLFICWLNEIFGGSLNSTKLRPSKLT